ncbi:unnamed protein product, partial [Phaeothamnion confervicola]
MAQGENRSRAASPISPAPPPEQQKEIIAAKGNVKMQELHIWYPLCYKWWQAWKAYTRFDAGSDQGVAGLSLEERGMPPQPPGPIDNSDLQGPEPDELRRALGEDEDYVLLPQAAYEQLENWYGGGPRFRRTVLADSGTKALRVELYPLRFKVYSCLPDGMPDLSSCRMALFSRSQSMSQVRATLLNMMQVRSENARFFVKVDSEPDFAGDYGGDATAGVAGGGGGGYGGVAIVVPNDSGDAGHWRSAAAAVPNDVSAMDVVPSDGTDNAAPAAEAAAVGDDSV